MSTATPQLPNNLIRATPDEGDAMEALRVQIDGILRQHSTARLVGPGGEPMEIPASAFHALMLVVQGMARGQTITLVPHGTELTTQEAADLLHVSRPHLVKLLDEGMIDCYKVGTHRRMRVEDVLDYRERRAGVRREKLDELTRLSEALEGGLSPKAPAMTAALEPGARQDRRAPQSGSARAESGVDDGCSPP